MVLPAVAAGARVAAGVAARNTARKAAARGAVKAVGSAETMGGAGIRNAQVRYTNRVDGLMTRAQLYARSNEGKREILEEVLTAEESGGSSRRNSARNRQLQRARIQQEAERVFNEGGFEYEPEEIQALVDADRPEEPKFPFFIVCIALLKDLLDALDLTVVGIFLTTLFTFILGAILFIWLWRDMSGPAWKKKHAEKMAKRLLAVVGLEFIPFLKIIPINTVWVLMNHYEKKNLAQALNDALSFLPARIRSRVQ